MNTLLKDNTVPVDAMMSVVETACSHRIRRLLPASVDRVQRIILDPDQRAAWSNVDGRSNIEPLLLSEPGEVQMKERIKGFSVDVRILILQHSRNVSEVHVELRMSPPFELASVFAMGIDDLWEMRLYDVADLLAASLELPNRHNML